MRCGRALILLRASPRFARSETRTMSDLPGARPVSRTLGDLIDEMAAATPNAEALVFRDERLDYAGVKARVDVFARALLAVGIHEATGSRCWSPTARNGSSVYLPPPRLALSSLRSARSRHHANLPGRSSTPMRPS